MRHSSSLSCSNVSATFLHLDLDDRILKQQEEEEERKRQRRERKKEKKVRAVKLLFLFVNCTLFHRSSWNRSSHCPILFYWLFFVPEGEGRRRRGA